MKTRLYAKCVSFIRHLLLCFFITVTGLLFFPETSLACELKIGWEPWPPYQFRDDKGNVTGLDVDLITSTMKGSGCKLIFFEIEWKAHLKRMASGFLDVALAASYTKERQKFGYYSDPYREEVVRLYVRKGEAKIFNFKTLADIVHYRFILGITSANYYGEEFEKLKANKEFAKHLEPVRSDERNILKIKERRIDGFLMDPFVVTGFIRSKKFDNPVEELPLEVYSCDIHALFSRVSVNPGVVQMFNQGLSEIKATGEYQTIVNRYLDH